MNLPRRKINCLIAECYSKAGRNDMIYLGQSKFCRYIDRFVLDVPLWIVTVKTMGPSGREVISLQKVDSITNNEKGRAKKFCKLVGTGLNSKLFLQKEGTTSSLYYLDSPYQQLQNKISSFRDNKGYVKILCKRSYD